MSNNGSGNGKKRRIFVAIGVPEDLQLEIGEWQKAYSKLPVRWLSGKNLHLTLVPPWYEVDAEGVCRQLEAVSGRPFQIHFSRVSFGPGQRKPRLIWAKGESSTELEALRSDIHLILDIEPERRPFQPHLTLARFRPERFSEFLTKDLDEKVDWLMPVNSFLLMESHLSSEGADYEKVAEFKLYYKNI